MAIAYRQAECEYYVEEAEYYLEEREYYEEQHDHYHQNRRKSRKGPAGTSRKCLTISASDCTRGAN
jgi:hypothetical protein